MEVMLHGKCCQEETKKDHEAQAPETEKEDAA
jgi:hypothetical protein